MDVDAANDAAIARLLAHDNGGEEESEDDISRDGDDDEFNVTAALRPKGPEARARLETSQELAGHQGDGGDVQLTASGRRRRKDTGKQRTSARSWSEQEEALFLDALGLHGRDWKKCADHLATRDPRAVTSHAQKHFIKLLLRGEPLPAAVAASGQGYTLSGKPLDPNCASARAYGLRQAAFHSVAASGKLAVGVHVTSLEMDDALGADRPRPQRVVPGAAPPSKRGRKQQRTSDSEDEGLAAALALSAAEASSPAEPTEYARSRPRRGTGQRALMGDTSESLDLTNPQQFVGPPGSAAPLAQPFSVVTTSRARLVMDFHAHLSGFEVIGLLGGRFDVQRRALFVDEAYPCRRAEGSDSGTSVELDPASQVEATTAMATRGQVAVGWYHSHPVFEARPSQKDNENQRNYQALCHDPASGLAPWVGAIVSPYDPSLPSEASQIRMWVVRTQGGRLTSYTIRSQVEAAGPGPPDEETQAHMQSALVAQRDDPSRADLTTRWRGFSRLVQGQPEGPGLTKLQKLEGALLRHLSSETQHAALSSWVADTVHKEWGVVLGQDLGRHASSAMPATSCAAEAAAEEAGAVPRDPATQHF